uniref:Uncharacterized protein n=1 Tax=Trichogramma kaykai TaxID=54128 RepID=A0ABD2WCL6_9HYME
MLSTYIPPQSFNLGERKEYKNINNVQTLIHVPVNAQFIPLRSVLKLFFEIPEIFDQTLEYLEELYTNDEIITNFVQAEYWKSRRQTFGDRLVLPLVLYFDDYENNNPLGPHRGISKTGAVYVSIPCLPLQYQSKLENIFVFCSFNSLDRQIFSNSIVFSKVIEELNFLNDSGIVVELGKEQKTIFFELVLIVADNLGLHSMLGLSESFNANRFCHHCLIYKSEKSNVFLERQCELRTTDNYSMLLETKDIAVTGLKEECVFHKIKNFHMCENICVDVMHDCWEGICRYDLTLLLNQFIYVMELFTLEDLNTWLRTFCYGSKFSINKPTEISQSSIKNGYIIMTSSEMLCFIRRFNLLVGLKISPDNECWELFITFKELVTVITSSVIQPRTHDVLETLVFEYLSQ